VTAALVLGGLLAALCVVWVARPFLREPAVSPGDDRLAELDASGLARVRLADERDRALSALKELEFDHRTGKVSDDDYRSLVGSLRADAARSLAALDEGSREG
jgi:hypothetical protein